MANLTATFKINLTYQGPGGGSVSVPQMSKSIPYAADSSGHVDVPAATADGASFTIPFGSIATAATGALIVNNTEQELEVKVNGSAVLYDLPVGGAMLICAEDVPLALPLTALAVLTTALTVAAGRVDYWVFGDPE